MDDLDLVKAVDRISQGVVVAVANTADRRLDPGLGKALGILVPTRNGSWAWGKTVEKSQQGADMNAEVLMVTAWYRLYILILR